MMEGGNNIFVAGVDVLGYLSGPMHKKYSMTFIWGHQLSTRGSYYGFFNLSHIPLGWTCKSIPAFLVCDLFDLITHLPFWLCSFAIVSSYCFTSEIQKFITHLNPITWTKTTPQKKRFFWSNPYKMEVMITSLLEILELPNFGHMTRFTI